jgi:Na+-translocating ferredoxin:NAD+ oxidoreductase subunit C
MLNKILNKNLKPRGLKIKPDIMPAGLDIIKIDKVNQLVFALEDSKFNTYIPTVKIGDKVKKDQTIAEAENAHGLKILASYNGVVQAIEKVKAPLAQKTCDAIIIKPEKEDYIFEDVLYNIDLAFNEYPKEMIFQKIVQANIQGLGGGLFLAGKKVLNKNIKHLILNSVECEPILNCDEALLTNYLAETLAGGLFLQKVSNAKTITIVVKENKKELISHLKHFIKHNEQFNNIAVATVPDRYPSGAEKEIIRYTFNKYLKAKDITTEHGFLVQNTMTAISVFRAVTCDLKQHERVVCVFGKNINNPKNVLVPNGTTVEDLLKFLKIDDVKSVRLGGLMMGEDIVDDRSIKNTALLKSSNGVILNNFENKVVAPCINCDKCIPVCPVDLIPYKMFKAALAEDFENKYLDDVFECMNCNLCNAVCPSNIDLVGMFKYAKQEKILIAKENERFEYIDKLTHKKMKRNEEENKEKERVKLERKKAREKRLQAKKEQENAE